MHSVIDFVKWALTHAAGASIVACAMYPLPLADIGREPWHYLYGTTGTHTTKQTLDERFKNYYKNSYSWEEYCKITADWIASDFATDCQGLLDAYLTYECGESTDINADMNYRDWCDNKGEIKKITRQYVLGEAVFIARDNGKMKHVGWICGFMPDGEPLVVEAKNIRYGVLITRLSAGNWTHRGLMSKKFEYPAEPATVGSKIEFAMRTPYLRGTAYSKMQDALDSAGYVDMDGKRLEIDGIWGEKSQSAFDAMLADYAIKLPAVIENDRTHTRIILEYM